MIPIYVRITIDGLRDQFSSDKKIMADHWNEETGFAIRACKDATTINTYITYTTRELEKCYNLLCEEHEDVTAKMLKDTYLFKPEPKPILMNAFKVHNDEFAEKVDKGKGTKATLGRYVRLQRKVQAYLKKKFKATDINLDHIQYSFAPVLLLKSRQTNNLSNSKSISLFGGLSVKFDRTASVLFKKSYCRHVFILNLSGFSETGVTQTKRPAGPTSSNSMLFHVWLY
jgi:hypothetical protein